MVLFETQRMVIRRFREQDGDIFFSANGDPEVMKYIRPAKSREESDAFLLENIRFYQDGSCLGRFAVFAKPGERFLGMFSFLYLPDKTGYHIGYALLPGEWGNGYATELVLEGSRYFFETVDQDLIYAITVPQNTGSQKVLLKSGFSLKGQEEENGKTLDIFCKGREASGYYK